MAKQQIVGAGSTRASALFILAALALASAQVNAASGDLSAKFPIDENNPTASLPSPQQRETDPLEFGYHVQDLVARGEGAYRDQDWAGAAKFYEALARAVPDRSISFTRLCSIYANLGKTDIAAANCGASLRLPGVRVMNHFRFVNLTLQKKQLTPDDVSEVEASLTHLRAHASEKPATEPAQTLPDDALGKVEQQHAKEGPSASLPLDVEVLGCRLAVRLHDQKRIDACLTALRSLHASPKVLLPFEWSRTLVSKDRDRSAELLASAAPLGFPPAAIEKMRAEQERTFSEQSAGGLSKFALLGLLGAVMAALGALVWKSTLSKRRLPRPATEI